MRRTLPCVLLLLLAAAANAGEKPRAPFTIERGWVDWDSQNVVNFVDIEIHYQKPVSRRQAQQDLMTLLQQEVHEWGLSFDYDQLPLWSVIYQDAAGVKYGLYMSVQPMLVDEASDE